MTLQQLREELARLESQQDALAAPSLTFTADTSDPPSSPPPQPPPPLAPWQVAFAERQRLYAEEQALLAQRWPYEDADWSTFRVLPHG